jgi:MFS family permease
VTFFVVFYLQTARGYTPLGAGVCMLPFALAQLVASARSADWVKRWGAKAVCTFGLTVMAATFVGYLAVGTHSSIWVLETLFLLQGLAIGTIMPPATESIMSSVPREKAGAGSAINNVARQVGGAIGIAVIGTVLASSYRDKLAPTLQGTGVPDKLRAAMEKSVEATHAIVGQAHLPSSILGDANSAFVHAMHIAALCSAAVGVLGAVVAVAFLPGRRGEATMNTQPVEPVKEMAG